MHDIVISAENLDVVRGDIPVLKNLNFSIPAGKVTGLIGPSGSGKTTLMRAIVGVQTLNNGSLQVLGVPAGSKQLRSQVGYVTQTLAVYDDLTARQNLVYFAAQLGRGKAEVMQALRQVDLTRQSDQLVGLMSGGQRARVSLAVALLGEPDILVLDEPTVGLDPVLRQSLWGLFAELAANGCSLLISSHVMDEAEQCPELLLLREGKILHHGPKQVLLDRTKSHSVHDAFLALVGGKPS